MNVLQSTIEKLARAVTGSGLPQEVKPCDSDCLMAELAASGLELAESVATAEQAPKIEALKNQVAAALIALPAAFTPTIAGAVDSVMPLQTQEAVHQPVEYRQATHVADLALLLDHKEAGAYEVLGHKLFVHGPDSSFSQDFTAFEIPDRAKYFALDSLSRQSSCKLLSAKVQGLEASYMMLGGLEHYAEDMTKNDPNASVTPAEMRQIIIGHELGHLLYEETGVGQGMHEEESSSDVFGILVAAKKVSAETGEPFADTAKRFTDGLYADRTLSMAVDTEDPHISLLALSELANHLEADPAFVGSFEEIGSVHWLAHNISSEAHGKFRNALQAGAGNDPQGAGATQGSGSDPGPYWSHGPLGPAELSQAQAGLVSSWEAGMMGSAPMWLSDIDERNVRKMAEQYQQATDDADKQAVTLKLHGVLSKAAKTANGHPAQLIGDNALQDQFLRPEYKELLQHQFERLRKYSQENEGVDLPGLGR